MVVYFAYDLSWNFIRSFEGFSKEDVFAKVLDYGLENCYLIKAERVKNFYENRVEKGKTVQW